MEHLLPDFRADDLSNQEAAVAVNQKDRDDPQQYADQDRPDQTPTT